MNIFISWSGEQSKIVATAIKENLEVVIQKTRAFLSTENIDSGAKWFSEIGKSLEECNFGIICITAANMNSNWLHFEAGALAKHQGNSRVFGYLIDIDTSQLAPPFSQFQNGIADKQSTRKLLHDINRTIPENDRVKESGLNRLFDDTFWPAIDKAVSEAKSLPVTDRPPKRSLEEMLEEVLDLTRSLVRDRTHLIERKRGRQSGTNSEHTKISRALVNLITNLFKQGDSDLLKEVLSGLTASQLGALSNEEMPSDILALLNDARYRAIASEFRNNSVDPS